MMQHGRLQLLVLFAGCVVAVWIFGPPLRPGEILLVGLASGLGVGATLGVVLVRTGLVKVGTVWGDGSLFRVAQGLGVAGLAYGSVGASNALIIGGAVLLVFGSIMEIRHARFQRRA